MSDLIHEMYEYFKYDPEATKEIHRFYVKFFKDCRQVLDVACGRGEFLELLAEEGAQAIGVDSDAELCEERKKLGLNIVCADAFDYLAQAEEASFDGIFISHFVEHLSYEEIASLFKLCQKVLGDRGKIVAVVPNVSSIGHHLDWFYRDVSHAGFRHPKIIEFLMSRAGLSVVESGENPTTLEPLLYDIKARLLKMQDSLREGRRELDKPDALRLNFIRSFQPREDVGSLKRFLFKLRWRLARYLFFPYIEELEALLQQTFSGTEGRLRVVNDSLLEIDGNIVAIIERLDRSFEAFVCAQKKANP